MNLLDNGRHVGDLVEEVKLSLVEVFGRTRQRTCDLLDHLLQQLPDISYTDTLTSLYDLIRLFPSGRTI